MSKDSSATYLHMHSPRLADHFEDFCRPHSSLTATSTANAANNPIPPFSTTNGTTNNPQQPANGNGGNNDATMAYLPGHFLPFEEIYLPPHLMPVNPEDEDDVVPDMHAAFGINRALGQEGAGGGGGVGGGGAAAQSREPLWRDFGLEELVTRGPRRTAGDAAGSGGVDGGGRNRKDGKRSGLMMMR